MVKCKTYRYRFKFIPTINKRAPDLHTFLVLKPSGPQTVEIFAVLFRGRTWYRCIFINNHTIFKFNWRLVLVVSLCLKRQMHNDLNILITITEILTEGLFIPLREGVRIYPR